jgi:hypothetical protein
MKEHQQSYTILEGEISLENKPQLSPSAQNIIEEIQVFTDLGVNSLNALTGSPKKDYWNL